MRGQNRTVKAVTLEGKGLLKVKDYPYPELKENCAIIKMEYFHYLHHRYFECNYGNPSVPWDRLFGSFFDGSKESKKMMKARLKTMQN